MGPVDGEGVGNKDIRQFGILLCRWRSFFLPDETDILQQHHWPGCNRAQPLHFRPHHLISLYHLYTNRSCSRSATALRRKSSFTSFGAPQAWQITAASAADKMVGSAALIFVSSATSPASVRGTLNQPVKHVCPASQHLHCFDCHNNTSIIRQERRN